MTIVDFVMLIWGSEDHAGAPDEHHEVHDGHHSAGHLVDGKADLLPAVNLAVPLGAPLVDLSPGVDGVGDQQTDPSNVEPVGRAIGTRSLLRLTQASNLLRSDTSLFCREILVATNHHQDQQTDP